MKNLSKNNDEFRGVSGLFFEYETHGIEKIKDIINEKYQTLTYFGFDKINLRNFILEKRLKGIDRIVPIGRALDMSLIWDGKDLINHLSRIINFE